MSEFLEIMAVAPDKTLDCLGLYCPMPVLKTRDAIRALYPGQVLELLSDDPGSEPDVKTWTARTGHELVQVERRGAVFRFLIRKSG